MRSVGQQEGLVLGMDIHEAGGKGGQHGQGHGLVIEESPGPPGAAHHAADQELPVRPVEVFRLDGGLQGGVSPAVELSFHDTAVRAVGNHPRIGLRPHQQGKRTEKDALAGAGLSR